MTSGFYIHYEDPQFWEPPWPGIRRLGPFLTEQEALNQAASDAAVGAGVPVGVFTDAESEAHADDPANATPVQTPAEITAQATTEAQQDYTEALAAIDQDRQSYVDAYGGA